jgi:hypothetical protein
VSTLRPFATSDVYYIKCELCGETECTYPDIVGKFPVNGKLLTLCQGCRQKQNRQPLKERTNGV